MSHYCSKRLIIGQPLESQASHQNPLFILLYLLLQSSFDFCVLWCYTPQAPAFHTFATEIVTGFTTIGVHAIQISLGLAQVAAQPGSGPELVQLAAIVHGSIVAVLEFKVKCHQ